MTHAMEVFQPLQADDPAVVAGFRLAARLGAGGMGRVYLSHTHGGRPVAIKVVRPELADDPDFRRRFAREIKAARRVRGAYTAELIDADADGVPPWLATLYVPGPSLAEAVARRGPLPVPAVLWLMAGVAEALQAIHAEGIVHRDLKPSNVLLAADGPRVIDFGISTAADGTAYTATGAAIGTPSFMAPEQASGDEATAATDVFALGQTAAFAALGRPLYGDGPAINVLYRIVHSEPDLSLLPEPLRPLLARCLAAEPAERVTAAEVVEWCRQRLAGHADAGGGPAVWRDITGPEVAVPGPLAPLAPVHTQPLLVPTRPVPQGGKTRRRRTALISAGGVAGALLVTSLAWSVMDAKGGPGHRAAAGSSASTGAAARPSASSSASPGSSHASASGAGAGTSGAAPSSSASPREPVATPYPLVWLDAKNSVNLRNPDDALKNREGDIRFGCRTAGCELESDTAVFLQVFGKPGDGTLDTCRLMLAHEKNHTLPLAAAANGTEICVKDAGGNIGLFVIQTKSTAMPDIAFLKGELTVWRKAA
ncbi:serine/threonine protein kinase [Streptomyces filipinensis]|uniref:Serine/threonine protein kinase n=1 Tax=Streptomyces filipinensis TaxID=66887 RepID=A0A918MDR7_9ACTN|nr:serine/threonine-protein kinase [Streptomyces filipinensis]GGV17911.1 serine/threonine protein kinase [Streptomyces filipinensis]